MKKNKVLLLAGLSMLALAFSFVGQTSALTLDQQSNNFEYENGDIHIKVTSNQNVPKYELSSTNASDTKYRVLFSQLFEIVDSNDNGVYDRGEDDRIQNSIVSLPSGGWEFSDPVNTSDGVDMNITSTSFDFDLTFVNHFAEDGNSMKFDVLIDNYDFKSDANNTMLVLGFTLSSTGSNSTSNETSRVEFGENGFFEAESTAEDDNGTLDVGFSTGTESGSNRAYLAYEKFNGSLVHDPTIGIENSISDGLPFNGLYFMFGLFALIPIVRKIKRQ